MHRLLGGGELGRAPAAAAAGAGGLQAGDGAVPDDLPLELGQGPEEVEDQPAAGGGGVDGLAQGAEPDPAGVEIGDHLDQVAQGAAEAVQAPDHQGVPRPQRRQDLVEGGAAFQGAGGMVGPDPPTAGRGQLIGLQVGVLLGGGDPRVAQQVPRRCGHGRRLCQKPPTVLLAGRR
jgi:hypothetical protein